MSVVSCQEIALSATSSVTGVAFCGTGSYPAQYQGTPFFADFARGCIWSVGKDTFGNPDPAGISPFVAGGIYPVDLQTGPVDDLLRAQIAVLLVCAMGWSGETAHNPFTDGGGIDAELWNGVAILAARNIARGYDADTHLRPARRLVRPRPLVGARRALRRRVTSAERRVPSAEVKRGLTSPSPGPSLSREEREGR